ncbi:MAG: imidazole glycerol phosphate synthase subunit HisH [Treponemataceae bacterium]|nr:imidazole glycerol phosphate synthase subunit HisH [Treponemataceae bacterium]
MIGIIDYNAGNIKSVQRALEFLKKDYVLSKNPLDLKNCDRVIFPGVGEAKYAMEQLEKTGFDSFIRDFAASGKPLFGICLGSQVIFDFSEESDTDCLGLIPGKIRHFSNLPGFSEASEKAGSLKIPHMGWSSVTFAAQSGAEECPLLKGVPSGTDFYFVHSYVIQPDNPAVIAGSADYGVQVPSVIWKDNIFATQFHPEKSAAHGLTILQNFATLDADSCGGASC